MPASSKRSLQRYRKKRDFTKTPEPSGAPRKSAKRLEFVIHRHQARRLHYDLRLEWAGVLKSWAVPKGPSLDPAEKRLAVQVEDHPFEYRKFSGDIPEGEYGAGNVIIWDRGTWVPEGDVEGGLTGGKLEFTLRGKRLRGRWALIRLRQNASGKQNWLLIKKRDAHAVAHANAPDITEVHLDPVDALRPRAPRTRRTTKGATTKAKKHRRRRIVRPAKAVAARRAVQRAKPVAPLVRKLHFIPPQLATAVDTLPAEGKWLTELKFDGYRILTYADGAQVRCFSRSGLDWTHRMRAVAEELAKLGLQDTWLDGELIAVDEHGIPQFQRLQQALDPASGVVPVYMVFDVLQLMGADLRARPLYERKRLLQQALSALERGGPVQLVDFVDGASLRLRDRACAQGFEGVILKDAMAGYRSGRNKAWLKLKCRHEQEFVIGGYTRTSAGRKTLTALLLGYYDAEGRLRFAGRAGTGFSEDQLAQLRSQLDAISRAENPFTGAPKLRRGEKPQWVRPELVAQVRFAEWTDAGILRQPLFLGLREDKAAKSVRREPGLSTATARRPVRSFSAGSPRRKSTEVRLTHPERVLFPADGITKRQLAEYYEAVAPVLWPHLRARPLSIIRSTGTQGHTFFQRHLEGESVPGLTSVDIPSSDDAPYFVCASKASIPLLAQMGAVELHTWGSRMPHPENSDRLTFDLDPDPELPWARVREAATLVRDLLSELGLQALLKTTGGHGLHVVVPLAEGPQVDAVAAFSKRVAEHLAHLIPQRFTAKRGEANRKGRIYVDWQRNQLGATTVSAYSPRYRPGVPVSLPIDWDELGAKDLRGPYFNLRNVVARLAEQGDAWALRPPIRQSLTRRMIDRLEPQARR